MAEAVEEFAVTQAFDARAPFTYAAAATLLLLLRAKGTRPSLQEVPSNPDGTWQGA